MLNDKILYTDFPLTIKENKLYSNLGKEILDLNSLSKEELLKLILKQINLINCNKRKFMKRKFKQLFLKWLKESNRDKHFKYAMKLSVPTTGLITIAMFILFKDMHPMGTFLAISIAVITAFIFLGAGMEFKDKQYGNKFDLLDLLATVLGALPSLLVVFIPTLIFYLCM